MQAKPVVVYPVSQQKGMLYSVWPKATVAELFDLPFMDLVFKAQEVHRANHDPNQLQLSTLLSIKTGGCPEDCAYCPQAARYHTGVEDEPMLSVDAVLSAAQRAKEEGATRFCLGAAWRQPKARDMPRVLEMVKGIKALGLEACATLGLLHKVQAEQLSEAGLDYYNHNLDCAPDFYNDVIKTRDQQDRLDTLQRARDSGLKLCCGGIVGMGETRDQRVDFIALLANISTPPESVPINRLVAVEGTPLAEQKDLDVFEFIRTIAVARIVMPTSYVRLSAGREALSDAEQTLCFMAGANSLFYGGKLLTVDNPAVSRDQALMSKLGIRAQSLSD